ncbi:PTS sugar transporter subunit IIC [Enterococcus sp. DIV0876]|uniref:PTS sugar transporter subunit IIC n=1 Tax=Enterococcus sp. DIV0876 TaxID=2774633 RepID=UPI003D3013D1
MTNFLQDSVVPKIVKFTQTRYMQIILNAFMSVTAITIAGSFFTLLKSIPIDIWQKFLDSSGVGSILSIPVAITTDIIALYVLCAISYQTAKSFDIEGFSPLLISLGSFLILTPFTGIERSAGEGGEIITQTMDNVIPVSSIGAQGIFLAIFVGILATRIYIFAIKKGWKLSMPESVPVNVSNMFASMIPGGLVFTLFLLFRFILSLTPFQTAQNMIYGLLQLPLTAVGGGIPGVIVYTLAISIFWSFGIHGGMVAYIGMAAIISVMNAENLAAFASGSAAPHPEWALTPWTMMGGAGSTLALSILIFFFAKSAQLKVLGKMSLPTSIFNVNEPLIFGMPVMMNPFLIFPFILVPIINLLLSLLAINIGFLAEPTGASINLFMPFGIMGMLANSHWSGFVWSIVILIIDIIIYAPFFKAYDRRLLNAEKESEVTVTDEVEIKI